MPKDPASLALVLASFALLALFIVGRRLNVRRGRQLLAAVRQSVGALGSKATFRPIGNSALLVEVGQPEPPIASASILILLEPRDFPIAWAFTRWRGRRDQLIVRADLTQPPDRERRTTAASPETKELGLARPLLWAQQKRSPHLQLSFGVGAGEEGDIRRALQLVARAARSASAS